MKGVARVAFLAYRAEIQAELEAGWPIKAVYERRAEKLGMSYQQFHRYVTAIIRCGQPAAPYIAPPFRLFRGVVLEFTASRWLSGIGWSLVV